MLKGNTIGEIYGPAMEITTQAEADEYFKEIVDHAVSKHGKSIKETERTVRANLGYYAGYYSDETRERVERLFKCCHPVFGAIASNGAPTVEQALNEGVKMGKALL